MSSGYLTTHVLDTARGCPAAGLRIVLFRIMQGTYEEVTQAVTNADGRTDGPILPSERFSRGTYELVFWAGDYLRAAGLIEDGIAFLDKVPIRFGMGAASHYHVPLLLSPYGYSTYRGS